MELSNIERMTVSVIVAREHIDHPWQDHVWRAVEIAAEPLPLPPWAVLRQSDAATLFHAGTATLELHRKDTTAYKENLESDRPALYVVLRSDTDAEAAHPIEVVLVAASAFDAQANAESGAETVERVAIPAEIAARIAHFVALHHHDERFVKRQRVAHPRGEDHLFGQEPLDVLRKRKRSDNPGDDEKS